MWLKNEISAIKLSRFFTQFHKFTNFTFFVAIQMCKNWANYETLIQFWLKMWVHILYKLFTESILYYLCFYFNIFIKRKISEPRASASESLTRTHLLSSLLIHWQSCPNLIITLKTCFKIFDQALQAQVAFEFNALHIEHPARV